MIQVTTSPTPFLSEIRSDEAIPVGKRAYFQEKLRNRLYDLVINKFVERQEAGFTKKDLAHRIGKKPEQVTRWLAHPGNWTIDTVSDLVLGICGGELSISISLLKDQPVRNFTKPEWLTANSPIKTQAQSSNGVSPTSSVSVTILPPARPAAEGVPQVQVNTRTSGVLLASGQESNISE
jgi:hypothetical protein